MFIPIHDLPCILLSGCVYMDVRIQITAPGLDALTLWCSHTMCWETVISVNSALEASINICFFHFWKTKTKIKECFFSVPVVFCFADCVNALFQHNTVILYKIIQGFPTNEISILKTRTRALPRFRNLNAAFTCTNKNWDTKITGNCKIHVKRRIYTQTFIIYIFRHTCLCKMYNTPTAQSTQFKVCNSKLTTSLQFIANNTCTCMHTYHSKHIHYSFLHIPTVHNKQFKVRIQHI